MRRVRSIFTLPITEVMSRHPATVGAEAALSEALTVMGERGISSVLVVQQAPSPYGILTMRDIVAKVVRYDLDPRTLRARDVATWRLLAATPSWTVRDAAETMTGAGIRRLPVVQQDDLLGIVSDTDLFIALAADENWEHARAVRKERAFRRARREEQAATVQDLMSSPVLTADPDSTVPRAVQTMVTSGVSSLLLGVSGGSAAGIVTKRDVVTKIIAGGRDPAAVRLAEIMSAPVRTIEAGASLETCSARMADERVRRFPATLADQIVGIISDSDILAAVIARRWRGHRRLRVPASAIVADIMQPGAAPLISPGLPTLSPELSMWEAADRLAKAGVPQLPVVQEGQVIGAVHQTDILQALEERGAPD